MSRIASGRISKMMHEDITEKILNCCFEVVNTLGVGFLETVYKNALLIAMIDKGLKVMGDRGFEVAFRGRKIGVLEYKRMYHPATYPAACDLAGPVSF